MGMSTFGSMLAVSFAGQKQLADLEQEQAQTDQAKASTQYKKMETQMQQKKLSDEQDVGKWFAANAENDAQAVKSPAEAAQKFDQAAQNFYAQGNISGAQQMEAAGKKSLERAKDVRVEAEKTKADNQESAAKAALDYSGNPTPENATALSRAVVATGMDPTKIPPPGIQFDTMAKQMATAGMSSKDKLAVLEKTREFDIKQKEVQDHHVETEQASRDSRAQTAAIQQGNQAMRAQSMQFQQAMRMRDEDRKDDKVGEVKSRASAAVSVKENTALSKDAKGYVADLEMANNVLGHLAEGGSAANDKQIQQALTSMAHGTGKATSAYYRDNKNFGTEYGRLAGFLSQTFTGRYTDPQRREIYEMATKMKDTVIQPALTHMEKSAKTKAEKLGGDPEAVFLSQEFDRKSDKQWSAGREAGGKVGAPGSGSQRPTYKEGDIAKSPDGSSMTFKNGVWVK